VIAQENDEDFNSDEEEDDNSEVRIIPVNAHEFADEDNEFVRGILRQLARGTMVGEAELYACEVALRRSRRNDADITSLSWEEEEDGYTDSSDDEESSSSEEEESQ